MAHVTADRVLQACTPVGTTSFSLGTAVTGFRGIASIPGIANNDTAHYSAWGVDADGVPTGEWENGVGTYASGTSSLTRTTVLSSSTGSAITFTASTVWLSVSLLAGRVLQADNNGKYVFPATTASLASLNVPTGTAPTTPATGDVWRTSAGLFSQASDGITQLDASVYVTPNSTQSSSSQSPVDITGMSFAMTANSIWEVHAFITFQSAATTTGIRIGYNSPADCTPMLEVVVPIVSTDAASALRGLFPRATSSNTGIVVGTGVTAINSNHTAYVTGIIRCGATAGNFSLQFASEVTSSSVTIRAGSTMKYWRLK